MRRSFSIVLLICLLSFSFLPGTIAGNSKPNPRPRLVILITIDGFQADQLDKYWNSISNSGFKRLIEYGQYTPYSKCQYIPNGNTADYASIFTGTEPYYHGIIADQFFDRKTKENTNIITDTKYHGVNSSLQISPQNLMATTIIDELKLTDPKSKAYAIAINPGEAMMMGGHAADGATWIDNHTGLIATSSYYKNGLPHWCQKLNEEKFIDKARTNKWEPALKMNAYHFNSISNRGLFDLKPIFYNQNNNHTTDLQLMAFKNTPLINDVIAEIATHTIREGKLGYDNTTDFMALQFNANSDYSLQGPSAETEDMYIRLDKTIADLLNTIDITVGLRNTVIAITSNFQEHRGVELLEKNNLPTGHFNPKYTMAILNSYLMAVYGQGQWVDGYYARQIYLNKKLIEDNKIKQEDIEEFTAQFMLEFQGVHSAYSSRSLQKMSNSANDRLTRMRNSFFKERSGDVVFNLFPGWTEVNEKNETMGNTSYVNSRVPIILFGIDQNSYISIPSTEDIAPTLCQIMHITFPNACIGQPIIK